MRNIEIDNTRPAEEGRCLSPKQVEEKLGISHATANKLMHLKGFPLIQVGRNLRVYEKDLYEFLRSYNGNQITL